MTEVGRDREREMDKEGEKPLQEEVGLGDMPDV
jgi:hypothetical protein